jgi:hypothetical protein
MGGMKPGEIDVPHLVDTIRGEEQVEDGIASEDEGRSKEDEIMIVCMLELSVK